MPQYGSFSLVDFWKSHKIKNQIEKCIPSPNLSSDFSCAGRDDGGVGIWHQDTGSCKNRGIKATSVT